MVSGLAASDPTLQYLGMMGLDQGGLVAKACVEAVLAAPVIIHDDGSRNGAYDLRTTIDGKVVAIEAKRIVERDLREDIAARPDLFLSDKLRYWWRVILRRGTRFRTAPVQLETILSHVEDLSPEPWSGQSPWDLFAERRDLTADLLGAGVEMLVAHEPLPEVRPPCIEIVIASSTSSPVHIDGLVDLVEQELRDSNVTSKLRRQLTNAESVDERHAFLAYGWDRNGYHLLRPDDTWDGTLPSREPDLPEWLDGVWVTALVPKSKVLAWLPSRGWIAGLHPEGASDADPTRTAR